MIFYITTCVRIELWSTRNFILILQVLGCLTARVGPGVNFFAIVGAHGERRARAYNGGLRAEHQRSPGAEPLVGGSGGEAS